MVLADHSLQPAVINFLLFSSHIFFSLRDLIVDAEGHIWTVVHADLGAAVGAAADDAEEQQLSVNAVGDVEEEEVGASAEDERGDEEEEEDLQQQVKYNILT